MKPDTLSFKNNKKTTNCHELYCLCTVCVLLDSLHWENLKHESLPYSVMPK